MSKLQITAVRNVEGDLVIAVMECDMTSVIKDKEYFLRNLKIAITEWVKRNATGKKMYEDNNKEFNFGDVSLCVGNPSFNTALQSYGILNFTMTVITPGQSDLDYDSHLVLD